MQSGSSSLFVVELLYTAPLAQIDAHMKAHVAFLKKHYAAGNFLVSGRQIPRVGGIIIATGKDRAAIEAVMREDPFCARGLADVRVVEFRASQQVDARQGRLGGKDASLRAVSAHAKAPGPLYRASLGSPLAADPTLYGRIGRETADRALVDRVIVPVRSGRAWPVMAGQVCRIVAMDGPQVVDFNAWNLHNPRERFWAARTKQLHAAHMRVLDRLWSCLPYLRPMATVTADSVNYGIDGDGAGCHDLLGTRCDPYVHKLLTGEELDVCCHSNLLRAVNPYRLSERDIHDVLNIFQVTGLTADTHQYFVKPCPAKAGDYFEFFAEIDLLCAISTCPHGDMSAPTWGTHGAGAGPVCRPIAIETYRVPSELLRTWSAPSPSDYRGVHGF